MLNILLILIGGNSLLRVVTNISFNIGERVVNIPFPMLPPLVGVVLLLLPFSKWISKTLSMIYNIGISSLRVDTTEAEDDKNS